MSDIIAEAAVDRTAASSAEAGPDAAGRPRRFRPSRVVDVAVLVLVALVLFLPGLTSLPVTDRDEARFVQATRQMVESGDVVDIRFRDEPRYQKPILIYWLQGAAVAVSGEGGKAPLFVYRLPSLLGAVASVLLTYAIGLLFGGRRVGLVAGLLAAATVSLGIEARLAKTDAVLLAFVVAAEWALARLWMAPEPVRSLPRNAVFWTALGLGVLTKGPVILLAAGPTLAAMLALDRSWRYLKALDPLRGLAWTVLIVAPWLIAIGIVSEGRFFANSVGRDLLAKVASGQESHGAPPGTHALVALATFWPLSAFLPVIFALPARHRLPEATRRAVAFLAAWILPGWLVVEAVPTKLPNYVLPFMPAIALLVAVALAAATPETARRWSVRIGFSYVAAGATALAFGLNVGFVLVQGHADPIGLVVGLVSILCAFSASWFLLNGRTEAGLAATVVAAGFSTTLGFAILLPKATNLWLSDRIAEAVEAVRPCADPQIVSVRYSEPSLVFRLGRAVRFLPLDEAASAWSSAACAVAVLPDENDEAFRAATGAGPPDAVAAGRNLNGMKLRTMVVHAKGAAGE